MTSHEGYEYETVIRGELELTVGGEVFTLHPGELVGFDSLIPHILRNTESDDFHGVLFVHGTHH